MTERNPFAMINIDGESVLAGLPFEEEGGAGHLQIPAEKVRTYIAVCEGEGVHGNARAVASVEGLWQPPVGSKVQLTDPNREATVCSVIYQIIPGGLSAVVYLDDPEGGTAPDPGA